MRYGHDESMGLIFDGNEPITMAEVAKRMNAMQGVIDRLDDRMSLTEYRCAQIDRYGTSFEIEVATTSVAKELKIIKGDYQP